MRFSLRWRLRSLCLKERLTLVISYRVRQDGPAKKIRSSLRSTPRTTPRLSPPEPSNSPEQEHADDDDPASVEDAYMDTGTDYCDFESKKTSRRSFKQRKEREIEQWTLIRKSLIIAATAQRGAHCFDLSCCVCRKSPVNNVCHSCGPSVYYCNICLEKSHEFCNQTHSPETYMVGLCYFT